MLGSRKLSRGTRSFVLGCAATVIAACGGGSMSTTNPPPPTAHEILFADSQSGIQAYSINGGGLTALAMTPDTNLSIFITGNMLTAAGGKFLLVTDSTGSEVKVFSVSQNSGSLTPVAGSPFPIGGSGGGSLAMDPSGQYLYAPYLNGTAAFSFNSSTGALTPIAGSPFTDGSSPFAGAVDPLGKFFYSTGSTAQAGLSVYSVESGTGALTPVVGSPFQSPLGNPPYNLVVSPAGYTLYATLPSNNDVLGWAVNQATGAPNAVPGSPFAAEDLDMFLTLDPAGKFLYTCNEGNGQISAYTVDSANGALTAIAGSPFGSNNCDTTVAVDPSGKYLYAAYPEGNSITVYSIDATTGSLTPLAGSPFPSNDATLIVIASYQ